MIRFLNIKVISGNKFRIVDSKLLQFCSQMQLFFIRDRNLMFLYNFTRVRSVRQESAVLGFRDLLPLLRVEGMQVAGC